MQNNILKLEINNKTKHLEKYIKPQWTWRTYLFLISLIAALTFTIIDLETVSYTHLTLPTKA